MRDFRIREAQKHADPTDLDRQHWLKYWYKTDQVIEKIVNMITEIGIGSLRISEISFFLLNKVHR